MQRRAVLRTLGAACAAAFAGPALAVASGTMTVTRMIDRLDEPWSLGFLPDGRLLVTERAGRLSLFAAEGGPALARIRGVPEVAAVGQGGLHDILIPRDFASSRQVYLSMAIAEDGPAGTAIGTGVLSNDATSLEGFRLIFRMAPGSRGGRHFGGRLVELPDGTLTLGIGDRGNDDLAQDLGRHEGKVIRIRRDGSVPADNPFVSTPGALPEILSYGHRNPQGAALDLQGRLWVSEHGARGGDEVNLIQPGANYGWPEISFGRHYSGLKIGIGTEASGMRQPAHYWVPSIAPSGHMIHSGRMFPEWRGHHFVGSLKLDHIAHLAPEAGGGFAETRIERSETQRVRDIREAPDGAIWFLSVGRGAAFRIGP